MTAPHAGDEGRRRAGLRCSEMGARDTRSGQVCAGRRGHTRTAKRGLRNRGDARARHPGDLSLPLGPEGAEAGLFCLLTCSAVPPAPSALRLPTTLPRYRRKANCKGIDTSTNVPGSRGYARVDAVSHGGTRRNPVARTHHPREVRRRTATGPPGGLGRRAASEDARLRETGTDGARASRPGERRRRRPGHWAAPIAGGQAGVALIAAQPVRVEVGAGARSASRSIVSSAMSSDGRPSR